jgi:ADP-ribose pyrophosphatase YjhB (NUDIX family)
MPEPLNPRTPEPPQWRQPRLTVDVIIDVGGRIVLIKRKNPPPGWAIPGGFVDYGETLEQAVVREAREETSLDLVGLRQFHVYSDPGRDPRHHTVTLVFTAQGRGEPKAADDAKEIGLFTRDNLPEPIAFDHRRILEDYFAKRSARE